MILKNILLQILASQKSEIVRAEHSTPRELIHSIDINSSFAVILSGIRRCGKSTLLRQIMNKLNNYSYFNFEDIRAVQFELTDFMRLEELFKEDKSRLMFYDEIQNINNWERYVRSALDKKYKIFVTGSNATLLSRELGTKLTGRYLRYELFPFSYDEFLKFKKLKDSEKVFLKYLKEGGFPEYLESRNTEYLRTLFDDIITRDIIIRYKIRNTGVLKNIALFLISNTGNLFTFSGIAKIFEIKSRISAQTYLSYLENCYLFFSVPMFSYSLKKQNANPRKIYSIDNGLINANTNSFSEDNGRSLENLVFLTLRKNLKKIYYFKQKKECDFVTGTTNKIKTAIQVCFELNSENELRELEGLSEAMEYFNLKEGYIVTFNQKEKLVYKNKTVHIIPFREWVRKRGGLNIHS